MLLGRGSSGGAVTSAMAPLSISSGLLSINSSGYLPTSHEAGHVGNANVNFGAFDAKPRTVTLENASGVTVSLEVDLGGNFNLNGQDGVITVPILNAWTFSTPPEADGQWGNSAESYAILDRGFDVEWQSASGH